jgi:hypothetical protein
MKILKGKTSDNSPPDSEPEVKTYSVNDPQDIIFEHFWEVMMQKQNLIGKQLEENDKKFQQQLDERRREMEESDRKFQKQLEERNRELHESDQRFHKMVEEEIRNYRHDLHEGLRDDFDIGEVEGKGAGGKGGKKSLKDFFTGKGKKGGKGGRGGAIIEAIDTYDVSRQFSKYGFNFDEMSSGRKILDRSGNTKAEFDLIMESPDCILAAAILPKPKKRDIDDFVSKLFMLREHRSKYHERRKINGAIIGGGFSDEEKQTVLDAGLFILEGSSMKIDVPEGFTPHEW